MLIKTEILKKITLRRDHIDFSPLETCGRKEGGTQMTSSE